MSFVLVVSLQKKCFKNCINSCLISKISVNFCHANWNIISCSGISNRIWSQWCQTFWNSYFSFYISIIFEKISHRHMTGWFLVIFFVEIFPKKKSQVNFFCESQCVKINPNFKIHTSFLIGQFSNLDSFVRILMQQKRWLIKLGSSLAKRNLTASGFLYS